MRRSLTLLASAALTLLATSAFAAGGINLSWNDCGVFGVLQRNFACNTNSGANTMVGSVVTGVVMNQLVGQSSLIEMQTNQATLSNWWQFDSGGCRFHSPSYLIADFNFLLSSNCLDPWGGGASGGINYTPGGVFIHGPNRAGIRTVCAIPGSTAITATDEYYMFKVAFVNERSIGTGSCAGCTDGACIVFQEILVAQPAGVGDYKITAPVSRNWIQWQGGGNSVPGGCPAATPTQNRTWGAVKSLYR
jgi:hypothetical protein